METVAQGVTDTLCLQENDTHEEMEPGSNGQCTFGIAGCFINSLSILVFSTVWVWMCLSCYY